MHSNGRDPDIIVLIAVKSRQLGYVFWASNAIYLIIFIQSYWLLDNRLQMERSIEKGLILYIEQKRLLNAIQM